MQDGGKKLRKTIMASTHADLVWEIPKGRLSPQEKELDCAIREFEEETSIRSENITIMVDQGTVVDTFVDNGVCYRYVYFLAVSRKDIVPKVNFKQFSQIIETQNIKWVSMEEIKITFKAKNKNNLVRLYKKIIKKFKKINKK